MFPTSRAKQRKRPYLMSIAYQLNKQELTLGSKPLKWAYNLSPTTRFTLLERWMRYLKGAEVRRSFIEDLDECVGYFAEREGLEVTPVNVKRLREYLIEITLVAHLMRLGIAHVPDPSWGGLANALNDTDIEIYISEEGRDFIDQQEYSKIIEYSSRIEEEAIAS